MLRIPCPFCGVRDESEFRFGGESHIARPPYTCGERQWAEYLYFRINPKGVHYERWQHSAGCRRWFNVARHTVSHEVLAVYELTAPKPAIGDSPQ